MSHLVPPTPPSTPNYTPSTPMSTTNESVLTSGSSVPTTPGAPKLPTRRLTFTSPSSAASSTSPAAIHTYSPFQHLRSVSLTDGPMINSCIGLIDEGDLMMLCTPTNGQWMNEELFTPMREEKASDVNGITEAAGIGHIYNANFHHTSDNTLKQNAARIIFLKHRMKLLQQQLVHTKEDMEREKSSAMNCIEHLQDENTALKERLECFEKIVATPKEDGPNEKTVKWFEQQLAEADEVLHVTKETFKSTSSILEAQIVALESELAQVKREKHDLIEAFSQLQVQSQQSQRSDKQIIQLQCFLERFEAELTQAKIKIAQLENQLESKEEECNRLKAQLFSPHRYAHETTTALASPFSELNAPSIPLSPERPIHSIELPANTMTIPKEDSE